MENGNQKKADRCLEEFQDLIRKEKGEEFLKQVSRTIGQLQDDSFMEGYRYAIQVLQDGMPSKDHT